MIKATRSECLEALEKAHKDADSFQLIKDLIDNYFSMINHMKETSLYDVYTYEEHFTKINTTLTEMLVFDNEKLKKEVNKLRKQLGLKEKYGG